jgi:hypothetical protein
MAEPGESEAVGPSGTRKHYIHNKLRNIISNIIQVCVKVCGESEAAGPSGTRKHCIHNKERNVISNLIQGCVKVCEEGKLLHPITTPIKRASFYTGMP